MNYRKKLGKQVDLRMELKKAWLCTELCLEKNKALKQEEAHFSSRGWGWGVGCKEFMPEVLGEF